MFEDFEGDEDDEDDIFNNGPGADHEGLGRVDASYDANMEGAANFAENVNQREEEMEEFNEPAHYKKDLLSLRGSDDERGHVYVDFNENGDANNPHLENGMKFSRHNCFREALRAWAIARGYSHKLTKNTKS